MQMLAVLQVQAATLGKEMVTVLATDPDSGQLAGVVTVSPGLTLAGMAEHLKLPPGQVAATLSSLAVAEGYRRQGLGRQVRLCAACGRKWASACPHALIQDNTLGPSVRIRRH